MISLLPHELVLPFVAGVVVGLLSYKGFVHPRIARRARIWRRVRG